MEVFSPKASHASPHGKAGSTPKRLGERKEHEHTRLAATPRHFASVFPGRYPGSWAGDETVSGALAFPDVSVQWPYSMHLASTYRCGGSTGLATGVPSRTCFPFNPLA